MQLRTNDLKTQRQIDEGGRRGRGHSVPRIPLRGNLEGFVGFKRARLRAGLGFNTGQMY